MSALIFITATSIPDLRRLEFTITRARRDVRPLTMELRESWA